LFNASGIAVAETVDEHVEKKVRIDSLVLQGKISFVDMALTLVQFFALFTMFS
jgi:hypothetical protein